MGPPTYESGNVLFVSIKVFLEELITSILVVKPGGLSV